MAKYVLAYHGGGMPETEAEQAAVMEAWGAWFGSMGAAVLDGGAPVGQASTIASDGSTSPGGGSNPVTGYSLIQADDLNSAIALAKGCPILDGGGSVEVAETIDM
ncbi:MAG: YciI family protein [Acidimicrobiales bacterium]